MGACQAVVQRPRSLSLWCTPPPCWTSKLCGGLWGWLPTTLPLPMLSSVSHPRSPEQHPGPRINSGWCRPSHEGDEQVDCRNAIQDGRRSWSSSALTIHRHCRTVAHGELVWFARCCQLEVLGNYSRQSAAYLEGFAGNCSLDGGLAYVGVWFFVCP